MNYVNTALLAWYGSFIIFAGFGESFSEWRSAWRSDNWKKPYGPVPYACKLIKSNIEREYNLPFPFHANKKQYGDSTD